MGMGKLCPDISFSAQAAGYVQAEPGMIPTIR